MINFQKKSVIDEISNEGLNYENAFNLIQRKANYFRPNERIIFLRQVFDFYQNEYDNHLKICKAENPEECNTSNWNIPFLFFMSQSIKDLEQEIETTKPNTSDFTAEDRQAANDRLDTILSEIEKLKVGQEVIWTDVLDELNEMRELFYLSKKGWRQLLTGKLTEMVAGGIISETISRSIVQSINPLTNKLLE